jgi:hypothetical protein
VLPEEALGVVLPDLLPRHRRAGGLGGRALAVVSERACGRGGKRRRPVVCRNSCSPCAATAGAGATRAAYIARPAETRRHGRQAARAPAGEAAAGSFRSLRCGATPGWLGLVVGGWDPVATWGPFGLVGCVSER